MLFPGEIGKQNQNDRLGMACERGWIRGSRVTVKNISTQYCAESRTVESRNGQDICRWKARHGKHNHSWDVRVYAYAALWYLRTTRVHFLERQKDQLDKLLLDPPLRLQPPFNPDRQQRSSMTQEASGIRSGYPWGCATEAIY